MLSLWGEPVAKAKPKPLHLKRVNDNLKRPIVPMTASAFSVAIHKLARKTNGDLDILNECPDEFVMLPEYLQAKPAAQVAAGFKACICEVLSRELETRNLLHKDEARGLIANLLRSLNVAGDKLVEAGCNLAWQGGVPKIIDPLNSKKTDKRLIQHTYEKIINPETRKEQVALITEYLGVRVQTFISQSDMKNQVYMAQLQRSHVERIRKAKCKRGAA